MRIIDKENEPDNVMQVDIDIQKGICQMCYTITISLTCIFNQKTLLQKNEKHIIKNITHDKRRRTK